MADNFTEGVPPVTELRAANAETTHAFRRKARPADRFFDPAWIFHAGKNHALRPGVENSGDKRIQKLADADNGRDVVRKRSADQELSGLEIERAVFEIDERVVEAGGGIDGGDIRERELLYAAADRDASRFEHRLRAIGLHQRHEAVVPVFGAITTLAGEPARKLATLLTASCRPASSASGVIPAEC